MVPYLSIVIPLRDEAPNARPLYDELTGALGAADFEYEVIVVDDGSEDGTFEVWAELQAADARVRVIRFRRNFGQTAAFAAGFAHARGRLIVTLDGDLQNDPHDIPQLIRLAEQGHDLVCGWRRDRKDAFLTRHVPSVVANRLISWATGVRLHDYGCSLKVFRSEVIKPLRLYGEMHRFLPALCSQFGARMTEVVVNHRPRRFGRSKYGLSRTFRVLLDLVTVKFLIEYSTRPMQFFGRIGLAMLVPALAIVGWLAWLRYGAGYDVGSRGLLLVGLTLFVGGLQMLGFGVLGELQVRTHHEAQNKPIYVIRDIREDLQEPVVVSERPAVLRSS